MVNILGKELEKKQEQQLKIIILLLVAGTVFYFNVYLPEQQRQQLEMTIQETIKKVSRAQSQDYSSLLTTCQNYLKWEKEGNAIQQEALENQKEHLNKAINWLIQAEKHLADQNQQARTQEETDKKKKEEEIIRKNKFHWQRDPKSWADDYLMADKGKYDANVIKDTIEKADAFTSFAHYKIHFPPSLWKLLTEEQQKLAKSKGHNELFLDEETKSFEFNQEIDDWYDRTSIDPVRGKQDPTTKKDNNALFYGTEGTGKTSIVRKLTYETDCYPLVEVKGSSLSPNKLDADIGIDALGKFIFTICDIEHTLEDDFGLPRETNGEVRYILFVDEADLVSKDARLGEYTYLVFLKECMEQISKEKQAENLWIFATNHLNMIARAVYRPGRLSNPLDFSWTLGDFMKYAKKVKIKDERGNVLRTEDITLQFPQHWHKTDTLNEEDNKWVNRFNSMSFNEDFYPFWRKFITHYETKKKLPEIKKDIATSQCPEQPGIQLGEFFEFFWNLKDSKQLPHFSGRWDPPRKPKIEESIPKITEAIDVRLKEIYDQLRKINNEMNANNRDYTTLTQANTTIISKMLAEIGKKIDK